MQEVLAAPEQAPQHTITPYERVRLGGDEFAICGAVTLAPGDSFQENIFILDVGFRQDGPSGEYGPYDIDGSGQKQTFDKPYVLVTSVDTEEGRQTKTYTFDAEEPVILGRGEDNDQAAVRLGFGANTHVSRKHAKLQVSPSGNIKIEDLGSTNGTEVKSAQELLPDAGKSNYGYTFRIHDFVHDAGKGAGLKSRHEEKGWGFGVYEGRNIIARDTPINGGVYPVGGATGEAIVVDDNKYPELLDAMYEKVIGKLDQVQAHQTGLKGLKKVFNKKSKNTQPLDEIMLSNVFTEVSDVLKYDLEATNSIARNYQKVSMDVYMEQGVGVCRTQALLSAYLIERLVKNGKLDGSVSIDRNQDVFEGVESGHAWARFTNKKGEVFIIDPAQSFVGTLEETQSNNDKKRWDYRRSEDLMRQLLAA